MSAKTFATPVSMFAPFKLWITFWFAVSKICAIIPDVVDFPFVPVIVMTSLVMYFLQNFRKSGQILSVIMPTKDVPDERFKSFIAMYAQRAIISDK